MLAKYRMKFEVDRTVLENSVFLQQNKGQIRIVPEWNVKLEIGGDIEEYAPIRIVPEWNVKDPTIKDVAVGGIIRIVPEWNVK